MFLEEYKNILLKKRKRLSLLLMTEISFDFVKVVFVFCLIIFQGDFIKSGKFIVAHWYGKFL